MLTDDYRDTGCPHGNYKRCSGDSGSQEERTGEEGGSEHSDRPGPARPSRGEQDRDRGEDERLDGKRRP